MRTLLAVLVLALVVPVASAKGPRLPVEAAVVQTGAAPCGIAAYGGELWIGVYEAGVVLRLGPDGRTRQRIRVGRWACRVAVDERAVWVTRDNADVVVRIDRRSGRQLQIPVASPFDVARGRDAVWVTTFEQGTVTRLDPRTGRVIHTYDVARNPAGITACAGRIWIGHGRGATLLTAIDPRSGVITQIDVVVASSGWPRCSRGELLVTTPDGLLRVSQSGALRAFVRLGGTPAEAAAAPGADGVGSTIWVTDKERSLVHRVDSATSRVLDAFPAGPGAYSLARLGRSMWITSFAGADVRRYQP